jgi:hypothetical protein
MGRREYSKQVSQLLYDCYDGSSGRIGLMDKRRNTWFQCFFNYVGIGKKVGFIGSRSLEEFRDFTRYLENTEFQTRDTNHRDIEMAENVLFSILKDCDTGVGEQESRRKEQAHMVV